MPFSRLRRRRKDALTRELYSETKLAASDLVMPYFVVEGKNKDEPIRSMPGIALLSADNLVKDAKEARKSGVKAILLFGVSKTKDLEASEAHNEDGVVQNAVRAIKRRVGDIVVITDVCLCGYTTHGHCGIAEGSKIDNDETLKILAKVALSHAKAGADFVAPSAMMDGQVVAIREALDKNGFKDTGIFAYSAKYASNFYGPFREALGSSPRFGDRKSYQMDYRNSDEALTEIAADIAEGADIVIAKPALCYLGIVRRARDNFNIPIAAYNVSGEYSMVKNQKPGLEKEIVLEILTSIKRSGADLIITYHAKEAAKWLKA